MSRGLLWNSYSENFWKFIEKRLWWSLQLVNLQARLKNRNSAKSKLKYSCFHESFLKISEQLFLRATHMCFWSMLCSFHREKYRDFTWFPGVEILWKGMRKLCLSVKFLHQEIRWNHGIFRSVYVTLVHMEIAVFHASWRKFRIHVNIYGHAAYWLIVVNL